MREDGQNRLFGLIYLLFNILLPFELPQAELALRLPRHLYA